MDNLLSSASNGQKLHFPTIIRWPWWIFLSDDKKKIDKRKIIQEKNMQKTKENRGPKRYRSRKKRTNRKWKTPTMATRCNHLSHINWYISWIGTLATHQLCSRHSLGKLAHHLQISYMNGTSSENLPNNQGKPKIGLKWTSGVTKPQLGMRSSLHKELPTVMWCRSRRGRIPNLNHAELHWHGPDTLTVEKNKKGM